MKNPKLQPLIFWLMLIPIALSSCVSNEQQEAIVYEEILDDSIEMSLTYYRINPGGDTTSVASINKEELQLMVEETEIFTDSVTTISFEFENQEHFITFYEYLPPNLHGSYIFYSLDDFPLVYGQEGTSFAKLHTDDDELNTLINVAISVINNNANIKEDLLEKRINIKELD